MLLNILKISSDYNCDDYYEPVCGCNGITYGNKCYAENAGVTEWIDSECNLDDEYWKKDYYKVTKEQAFLWIIFLLSFVYFYLKLW